MNIYTTVCDHGFWLAHCAKCHKFEGECDYGSCEAPATTVAEYVHADRVVERRPMCEHHATVSAQFANSGSIASCKVMLNGYRMETLEDVLCAHAGYRNFEQLEDEDEDES